jgi:hypothetical protein
MHPFLFASELQECARAIAIAAHRFEPDVFSRAHSVHELAEIFVHLPIRQISTLHVDTSTLKKTFANQEVSKASVLKFPRNLKQRWGK